MIGKFTFIPVVVLVCFVSADGQNQAALTRLRRVTGKEYVTERVLIDQQLNDLRRKELEAPQGNGAVKIQFYQTWLFFGLIGVGLIGLFYLALRRRLVRLRKGQALQQAFSRQLIESQENERKRIAAELHDGLGQNLLVIKNRALIGLLQRDNHQRIVEQLEEISTAASQTIDEVRQIAANLHPYQLERIGLTRAIEAIVRKFAGVSQINFVVEVDDIDGLFEPQSQINIYRIVQECLNNIVKHSAATEAGVLVSRDHREVKITIWDNGCGFALGESGGDGALKYGFGLTGISERTRMLGGTQTIDSAHGLGTVLTMTIGLRGRRQREKKGKDNGQ